MTGVHVDPSQVNQHWLISESSEGSTTLYNT
jgi:hypothetical protein